MTTGAELICKMLVDNGTKVVFELPGGAFSAILNEIKFHSPIRVVLNRHEQASSFAADAYARVTGSPGVCMATSGPGASNLVTGIANAYFDSIPIVAITGQVATKDIKGTRPVRQLGFQEMDIVNIVRPITKKAYLLSRAEDIVSTITEAFEICQKGRPGPVLIDIPMDVQFAEVKSCSSLKSQNGSSTNIPDEIIDKTVELFENAKKPLIWAGGGVILSNATDELKEISSMTNTPVATSLLGKGVIPENSGLSLGMMGHLGSRYCNIAIYEADFILIVGARCDIRSTGTIPESVGNKSAKIVRIDIDEAELNSRVIPTIAIKADAKIALKKIISKLDKKRLASHSEWLNHLEELKHQYPLTYDLSSSKIKPQYLIQRLSSMLSGKNYRVTVDVGQHQMWVAQFFKFDSPRRHLSSGGHGSMGYGLPAAIGAYFADPQSTIVNITGDGSFQINIQELATIREYGIPVKIIILNNASLGIVKQFENLKFKHPVSTEFGFSPDFAEIAKAYGINGIRIDNKDQVDSALKGALSENGAYVIDARIEKDEGAWPMLLAGDPINRQFPYLEEPEKKGV